MYLLYILICSKKISHKLKIALLYIIYRIDRVRKIMIGTKRLRKMMRLDNVHWRHSIIADSG